MFERVSHQLIGHQPAWYCRIDRQRYAGRVDRQRYTTFIDLKGKQGNQWGRICGDPDARSGGRGPHAKATRDDDTLVPDLGATALARIYPEHSSLRRLTPWSKRRSKRAETHTSLLVHGTFARNETWWQPGGDFHGYL